MGSLARESEENESASAILCQVRVNAEYRILIIFMGWLFSGKQSKYQDEIPSST